jgi:hypothetical protein
MKVTAILLLSGALAIGANAQRPRTIEPSSDSKAVPAPAPPSVKAKYEGGVFGHNKTMEGMLSFDDTNHRLLFGTKERKEVLFIPYEAITSAFADTQKKQPAAATVAGSVPSIYSLPAHFIKTKVRYLTVQFSDPDTKVGGITSFRLENKDILASVLATLAEKASMTQRGDIYIKKRDTDSGKLNP